VSASALGKKFILKLNARGFHGSYLICLG